MPDETTAAAPIVTDANAPFIYFETVSSLGLLNGIGQLTLEANRLLSSGPDGRVAVDRVVVAHLRSNLPALRSLRAAIDGILLMAEPTPEGPAN